MYGELLVAYATSLLCSEGDGTWSEMTAVFEVWIGTGAGFRRID